MSVFYQMQYSQRGSPSVLSQDEGGRHSVVPSRPFLNLPDKKNLGARTDEIVSSPSSPTVPHHPPPSPAVFHRLPLFSVVFRFFPRSPAVPRRPPPSSTTSGCPLSSPTVPYKNMSQIVGLVVLPNDGCPRYSRTRTDGILSSCPVIFSSCPTSRNERRGRTTLCRLVSSRALGSPPAEPYGGPGRLRTQIKLIYFSRRMVFSTIQDSLFISAAKK